MTNKERARMEVLLEEIKDKIEAVADGHDNLFRAIQNTKTELSGRIDNVELAIRNLSGRVGNLEKGQEVLIGKAGSLEIGQIEIKNEIKKIRFRLDDHEARLKN